MSAELDLVTSALGKRALPVTRTSVARRARGAGRTGAVVLLAVALAAAVGCSGSSTSTSNNGTAPRAGAGTTIASATGTTMPAGPVRSAGCSAATPVAPGTTDERLTSQDVERSYQLIVPASYDGKKPLPLVLGLHSLTIDYRIVPGMSGFADMAPTYDYIGVSPSGRLSGGRIPYWNAAPAPDNYDVAFIGELLDHLGSKLCLDTTKVFSMGMSNGAQLSSLLACELNDRIAAIGPIAGVEFNEPCGDRPIPIMAFHGDADPIVPYGGGGLNSVTIANQNYYRGSVPPNTATPTGVDESMKRWAEHNKCGATYKEERLSPEVRKRTWPDCAAPTILYIHDGGGHAWPGKPQPAFEAQFGKGTKDIDATNLLFAFFFNGAT